MYKTKQKIYKLTEVVANEVLREVKEISNHNIVY